MCVCVCVYRVNRTNCFAAVTHNEQRVQFQLVNRLYRVLPSCMDKSLLIAVRSSTKRYNKTCSYT